MCRTDVFCGSFITFSITAHTTYANPNEEKECMGQKSMYRIIWGGGVYWAIQKKSEMRGKKVKCSDYGRKVRLDAVVLSDFVGIAGVIALHYLEKKKNTKKQNFKIVVPNLGLPDNQPKALSIKPHAPSLKEVVEKYMLCCAKLVASTWWYLLFAKFPNELKAVETFNRLKLLLSALNYVF